MLEEIEARNVIDWEGKQQADVPGRGTMANNGNEQNNRAKIPTEIESIILVLDSST